MSGSAKHVVVVGGGLAGHEAVRRLLAAPDFDGTVTWFGAEADRPYNRVLLTDLLAGSHDPDTIHLPTLTDPRLVALPSRPVSGIDRVARTVRTGRGSHQYSHVILATGAEPVLPPVRGSAVPLRTLADARTVLRALESGTVRRIGVLGGGPLGVQIACALAGRVAVEVVHQGPYLLDGWLDGGAGALLEKALLAAGVTVRCDSVGSAAGGYWPRADLVLVACGSQPRSRLAQAAGLPVGRGVLVDRDARSLGDERVFAIGDCAEASAADGLAPGLALTALAQAQRAVAAILGTPAPNPPASGALFRLRSHHVPAAETAALRTAAAAGTAPTLHLTDQHRRTHKSLTLDPTGTRVVSATLVGDVSAAATLTAHAMWPVPIPENPATMLLG